jgi:hypothetical protein
MKLFKSLILTLIATLILTTTSIFCQSTVKNDNIRLVPSGEVIGLDIELKYPYVYQRLSEDAKELEYGETYTSKEIHTQIGFGYGVCHDCYEQEWARKEEVERVENRPLGEKLITIISHYGVIPQLKYLQTEIFEFNEAVIKHEDDIYYMAEPQDIETSKEHIEEEFADVMVMMEQFKVLYGLDNEKIIDFTDEYFFTIDNEIDDLKTSWNEIYDEVINKLGNPHYKK